MTTTTAQDQTPTGLLKPAEAARYLGVHLRTLRQWKANGGGPAVCRLEAGTVRYRLVDLEAYVAAHVHPPGAHRAK